MILLKSINPSMKKYSQNNSVIYRKSTSIRSLLIGILISIALTTGCVESNIDAGNSFIPPSQELNTFIDSTLTVKTYPFAIDSIPTSALGGIFIGGYQSAVFGATTSSGFGTYFPQGFQSDTLFGLNPTLDSMKISLHFIGYVGDTSYKLKITAHEITDLEIRHDNAYYSNLDPTGHYDPTPLATFEFTGGDTIIDAWLPESFYSKLLLNDGADENNPYYNDTLFIQKFKGLYFKAENQPSISQEGIIRQLNLGTSTMFLYYHNEAHGEFMADTTYQQYYFFTSDRFYGNNFSCITHNYSTADPSAGGVVESEIGNSSINSTRALVQGMAGLGSKVEVDTLRVNQIKADAKAMGYSHVALHSAKVIWGLEGQTLSEDVTLNTIEDASSRLVMFHNINTIEPVKDYDPYTEADDSYDYISPIGGDLNRSTLRYELNITSTMQNIFNKPDGVYYNDSEDYRTVLELVPSWDNLLHYNETVVGGGSSMNNKPQVVLVYTLVK